ncbi:uncharacterized protein LOC111616390 isoform X3 [Centruroides sculpturatus]|uniref:uncharacterized protein LOC111616390 isoform X3 n=1 Tax=Centruroides sculpturatus TaxID=218467 RepID=UPI000C6E9639|nr:uncharacterized protein LOC111616390 isoform X3 [Centruroides sculpturatus]
MLFRILHNDNNNNYNNNNRNGQYNIKKNIKLNKKFDYPSTAEKEEWLKKLIINLTDIEVPKDYLRLLSYGSNMNLPIFTKTIEVVAEIESIIQRIPGKQEDKNQLRKYLSKDLQKYKGKDLQQKKKQIVTTDEYEVLPSDPTEDIKKKLIKLMKTYRKEFTSNEFKKIVNFNNCIPDSKYTIKNADQLISRLMQGQSKDTYRFLSLDIKSMYPSINWNFIMESLSKYDLPCYILEFIQFTFKNNYFKISTEYYRQRDGIAMGSVIGPKLADICMASIDEKIFQYQGIVFYTRYVDDILVLYDSNNVTAENIKDYANSLNKNIKFTYEEEKNYEINYLDVIITRKNETLLFRKYEKICNNNKVINYKSYSSIGIKRNVFLMELKKIFNRTTLKKYIEIETKNLFKKYLLNDYPQQLIPNEKQSKNPLEVAEVVYELMCTCTERKSYVGETGRKLEVRLKEHEAAIRLNRTESPWQQHCSIKNCLIDRSNIKILYKEKNFVKRRIIEHYCIKEHANCINLNTGAYVDACWDSLMNYNSTGNLTV